jgi:hypothetical protein
MRIRRLLLAFILPLALASNVLYAQVLEPVKWSFSRKNQ